MKKTSKVLSGFVNILIAVSLASMSILVFGNVVLRYVFNSGITWSEEMSRFLFVWMVFLGAIAALKENMHLGVDVFVKLLPEKWRKLLFVISNLMVLYVLWLVLDGSWKMTILNMASKAPATGLPLSFVYGIGILMSIAMAMIILKNVYKAFFGEIKGTDLSLSPDISQDIIPAEQEEQKKGGA
ncbi:TRAP transporter small permease [Microaerobacter geothermalis]|uniref:TRAP transporter small permease n=1 Tax=Microaerobacter geothermalis TaxID=674972 RepID=UPI001F2AA2BA|nr:TRAP transporter small permease [Microaerobacter geothermalis]MCF6092407.1 TRAP transporter small permease [Microaerobacter geothermalis]